MNKKVVIGFVVLVVIGGLFLFLPPDQVKTVLSWGSTIVSLLTNLF